MTFLSENEKKYKEAVPYLLSWYDFNARILPWRQEPSPYFVWVSEIMLQQTRVEAVRGYFDRFLRELPDIQALAEVSEERLLKLWEGLGYYNRARNMQRAAKQVCEQYGGQLPREVDLLRALPGIGDYTAGAIASIAYGVPEPAVDGNVLRVMSRLTGSRENVADAGVKAKMIRELRAVMPKERPGEFNQAIMDIGATICIPNGVPHCDQCPVQHLCRAFAEGCTDEIPVKPQKKQRRVVERIVLVIECHGSYLLRKRASKGLLAGLWEFPGVDVDATIDNAATGDGTESGAMAMSNDDAADALLIQLLGEEAECLKTPDEVWKGKHIFSHVEWNMTARVYHLDGECPEVAKGCAWATVEELRERYSLPGAFSEFRRRILAKDETAE